MVIWFDTSHPNYKRLFLLTSDLSHCTVCITFNSNVKLYSFPLSSLSYFLFLTFLSSYFIANGKKNETLMCSLFAYLLICAFIFNVFALRNDEWKHHCETDLFLPFDYSAHISYSVAWKIMGKQIWSLNLLYASKPLCSIQEWNCVVLLKLVKSSGFFLFVCFLLEYWLKILTPY